MGFTKPDLPDVDPDTFMQKPLMERMRILGHRLGGQRIRLTKNGAHHLHREAGLLLRRSAASWWRR